jgi:prevent-host-death family protein
MFMKTIPATKASKQFGELIDAVQREPVMVTKKDRPVGVMMSIQDAETLLAMQTELGIARGLSDIENGRYSDFTPKYAKAMAQRFKARLKSS